ncbi:hypothetical protein BKL49_10020 [Rodentibacter myodis]|uniref:Phospholipase/carboxylesterase/thioesterase domain-containing protein n=2 Tax=Rodentibacter myodis TaxID=1907939 RepID=A0A1V3JK16_9PAST|nr:hypothetical protein BKL49_10020 [Rodentibacter myodis]
MPFTPRAEPLKWGSPNAKRHIILLHGLTGSGRAFLPIAQYLNEMLATPSHFILPSAPLRSVDWADNQRVSGWYNLPKGSFLQQQDQNGLLSAMSYVHSLLDELNTQGIEMDKVIIGGFSQGGALSLLSGLLYPHKLGGIFALSGYLPIASWIAQHQRNENRQTPIFLAHGELDNVISLTEFKQGMLSLSQENRPLVAKQYPIGHYIVEPEVADLAEWINSLR